MKNKYAKRARISEAKIREIVRYVAADLTALQAAALSGLNRNTVNRLYRGVRERMLLACEAQRQLFGVVEVDESFFGARRVKGRRGRGAYGKTVVFGIFERQGHVYTEIVPDCSKPTLQGCCQVNEFGAICGRVDQRSGCCHRGPHCESSGSQQSMMDRPQPMTSHSKQILNNSVSMQEMLSVVG